MLLCEDQTFQEQIIEMDGQEYKRCAFIKCELRHRGGQPVRLIDCTYEGCRLELLGTAANTAFVLKDLLRTPGLQEWAARALGLSPAEASKLAVVPKEPSQS
jgi:hypothetical protein